MDTQLFLKALKIATDAIEVPLTDVQAAQCAHFAALVVETNQTLNLTRITEPEAMAVKHFADSLTLLKAVPELKQGAHVCDVGTGAGFPGVPVKIVRPDLALTLVDSLRKRLNFLDGALKTLGIHDVTLVHTRAETLKNAQFDLVTARAVAALPRLIAWCAPLVKPGGLFVAMKGAEVEDDEGTAQKAGLTLIQHLELTLPGSELSRRNVLVWVK